MISRFFNCKSIATAMLTVVLAVSIQGCQKVSVPRVSSKFGNVDEICTNFVMHYLDTDGKTFAASQAQLRKDASPGLIQTMTKNGILAKDDKSMKAKLAQLAKRKGQETVVVKKVEEGEVAPNRLIPVRVTGEIQKGSGATYFAYVLGVGVRKDNNKLAIVTITKQ